MICLLKILFWGAAKGKPVLEELFWWVLHSQIGSYQQAVLNKACTFSTHILSDGVKKVTLNLFDFDILALEINRNAIRHEHLILVRKSKVFHLFDFIIDCEVLSSFNGYAVSQQ